MPNDKKDREELCPQKNQICCIPIIYIPQHIYLKLTIFCMLSLSKNFLVCNLQRKRDALKIGISLLYPRRIEKTEKYKT
jgi:hypothetical protein